MKISGFVVVWVSILLSIAAATASAQDAAGINLAWAANRPLSWADFKGIPEEENELHAATTFAGIVLEVEEVRFPSGKLEFRAYAVFDSQRSWAQAERCDEEVLKHEQRHFDIAEIYARLLEQKLNALRLHVGNKEKAKQLYDQFTRKQLSVQAKYDAETAHGLNKKAQHIWDKQIQLAIQNPALAQRFFRTK